MKGIYLTEAGKQEIEAKIAELEYIFEREGELLSSRDSGKYHLYKEILSSATILPVEESWLDALHKSGKLMIEHVKETNGKPTKGPFDLKYSNGVIISGK